MQAMNEVLESDPRSFLNGTAIVERLLNRKFNLPTGTVYLSSGGQQYPDMAIKQINPTNQKYEVSTNHFSILNIPRPMYSSVGTLGLGGFGV